MLGVHTTDVYVIPLPYPSLIEQRRQRCAIASEHPGEDCRTLKFEESLVLPSYLIERDMKKKLE